MIGRTIHHYTILRELGAGGMGRIYLARDDRVDRQVALKFLPGPATPDQNERLLREARAAARLTHPGIVTLYGFEDHAGERFLVQEYVAGESLAQRLTRGPLGVVETLRLARELTAALAHAHAHGVVHRDLKPDNVLIAADGSYKIADFGIARLEDATTLTEAGSMVGTLAYLAPECLRGHRGDVKADLFALGAVLYEAASGKRAFPGATEAEVMYQLTNESPTLALGGTAGAGLANLIEQLLEKEPARRPVSAQAVEGVIAGLTTATSSLHSRPSRRGWLVPALVLAGLAVVAAGIALWRMNRHAPAEEDSAVAVLYFDNVADPGDREKIGPITGNLLVTSLAQTDRLNVLGTQRILDALRQLGRSGTTVDKNVAMQVARRVHARRIVTGSVLQVEPFLVMTAEISDVRSGKVVDAVRITGEPGQTVFQVVDRLGGELVRRMSRASETTRLEPVAERTSSDLEAVRSYLRGLDHFTAGNFDAAELDFRAAIARDSSFVQPWYQLAITRWWQGEPSDARLDIAHARARSDRLSATERATLEAIGRLVDGDWVGAEQAFDTLERENPGDKLFSYGEVEASYHAADLERAIDAGRRTLAIDSTFTVAGVHVVDALSLMGAYDEAERVARTLLRRSPENRSLWSTYLATLASRGKGAEMCDQAFRWRSVDPHRPADPLTVFTAFNLDSMRVVSEELSDLSSLPPVLRGPYRHETEEALKYLRALKRGRYREAVANAAASWKRYPVEGIFPGPSIPPADGLLAAARTGRSEQALAWADSVAARVTRWGGPSQALNSRIARINVNLELGRVSAARQEYERLAVLPGADQRAARGYLAWSNVRILAAEGRGAEALASIPNARMAGPPMVSTGYPKHARIEALMAAGRSVEALGAIDTLLDAPALWPDHAVLLRLWRGRLLERLGRSSEAAAAYREFLTLWKDADVGMPEIAEARGALVRIEATPASKLATGRKP